MNRTIIPTSTSPDQQIARFSPGTLLWRIARSSPREIAMVSPTRTITYAELASLLLHAAHNRATMSPAPLCIGVEIDIASVLRVCMAFACAQLVEIPCDGSHGNRFKTDCVSETHLLEIQDQIAIAQSGGQTVGACCFSDLALVQHLSHFQGLGWSSEGLSYAWGLSCPAPSSVSVLTNPIGTPMNWSALFGVLLARGRVVIPGEFGASNWLEFVKCEAPTELHLSAAQLKSIISLPSQPIEALRKVVVWHDSSVPNAELQALTAYFPNAEIARVLAWSGGPIARATLAQLILHGEQFIGRTMLGLRPSVSPRGELLISESPCLPHRIDLRTAGVQQVKVCNETGITVEIRNSDSHRFGPLYLREGS